MKKEKGKEKELPKYTWNKLHVENNITICKLRQGLNKTEASSLNTILIYY